MKLKYLGLIPLLLLSSCGGNRVYRNVSFYFNTNKHHYVVYVDDELKEHYIVEPNHYYKVKLGEYYYVNNELIQNEFFLQTKELFVYYR